MAVKQTPQTSIYEETLDDTELEKKLAERQKLKEKASEARALFEEADQKVKAAINDLDLGLDAPVRCGNYLITRTMRKGRDVSFSTEAKMQLKIATIGD